MMIRLVKPETKELIETKLGFSWTTLFFGCFSALFRGDWLWALIMLVTAFITLGFSHIIFGFMYNKIYIKNLLKKGYIPYDDISENALINKGYIVNIEE